MTSVFRQVKQRLASATLFVHPVPDAELHVNTDASTKAIAGAIHQVVNGRKQPLSVLVDVQVRQNRDIQQMFSSS